MTARLMPETQAPALDLPLVGGGRFSLAEARPEAMSMVVFYRGYHCPLCKTYMGKLDSMADEFLAKGIEPVAVSMDGEERAAKTRREWGLENLPVAYGLDEADARAWGLWVSTSIKEGEADVFIEPGMFWVRPDGRLYLIDISNMPFARPDLDLLLSGVALAIDKDYPARGTRAA